MLRNALNNLFFCFFILFAAGVDCEKVDFRLITVIRNGIERSLDYISANLYRSKVDVVVGVAFARSFMKAAYKNGTHIMDKSTLEILEKCERIINDSTKIFGIEETGGPNEHALLYIGRLVRTKKDSTSYARAVIALLEYHHLTTKNTNVGEILYNPTVGLADILVKKISYIKRPNGLVMKDIWTKPMDYSKRLLPLENFSRSSTEPVSKKFSSDNCMREIISGTQFGNRDCSISAQCWNEFFRDTQGDKFYLTHKLLLLQVADRRGCDLDRVRYHSQTTAICTSIFVEIRRNIDSFAIVTLFDLFLEQVLLCGYEGFGAFIRNDWLFDVIKAQRSSGCFEHILVDNLKSRIKKRSVTFFEDGCNDHSTGLGTAVLALYYNFIVNEESVYY